MRCPNCGKEIPEKETATFCLWCGKELHNAIQQQKQPFNPKKLLLVIPLFVVLVVLSMSDNQAIPKNESSILKDSSIVAFDAADFVSDHERYLNTEIKLVGTIEEFYGDGTAMAVGISAEENGVKTTSLVYLEFDEDVTQNFAIGDTVSITGKFIIDDSGLKTFETGTVYRLTAEQPPTDPSLGDEPVEDLQDKPAEKIQYEIVTVSDLIYELESNALRAERTYQDAYIEISGELGSIDSDGGYFRLIDPYDEWGFDSIHCSITDEEQIDALLYKNEGDWITVQGQITSIGEIQGYYLDVHKIDPQDETLSEFSNPCGLYEPEFIGGDVVEFTYWSGDDIWVLSYGGDKQLFLAFSSDVDDNIYEYCFTTNGNDQLIVTATEPDVIYIQCVGESFAGFSRETIEGYYIRTVEYMIP